MVARSEYFHTSSYHLPVLSAAENDTQQACRTGGSRASHETPLEVNNGGLKTQSVDFQLLANSGGMENKLKLPCKKTLIVL